MKPISPVLPTSPAVPEMVLAEDQPEYLPLPVATPRSAEGSMISRWQLTPGEIEQVQRHGCIWIDQWTFGGLFQPIRPTAFEPHTIADLVEEEVVPLEPQGASEKHRDVALEIEEELLDQYLVGSDGRIELCPTALEKIALVLAKHFPQEGEKP